MTHRYIALSSYILDVVGALIAFILWHNEVITLWGVAGIILVTAAIATGLTYAIKYSFKDIS